MSESPLIYPGCDLESLRRVGTLRGGRVLNVGYGLGYVDGFIEGARAEKGVREHHIIEMNQEVLRRAESWRERQPHKESIFLHQGDWRDVLPRLHAQGLRFQGVIYDGFPLEPQELHRDSVPFVIAVAERKLLVPETGVLTFYLDSLSGLGEPFESLVWELGFKCLSLDRVQVCLPKKTQYWSHDYFLVPTLTGLTS